MTGHDHEGIQFTASRTSNEAVVKNMPPYDPDPGARTRILVVDDDQRIRRVVARLLEADGFLVAEAASADAALHALDAEGFPLVVSDVSMPGQNGLELLREIRVRHPETSVMMLTGDLDVGTAVACLQNGAIDYLPKPVRQMELTARVNKALGDRHVAMEVRHLRARYQEDLEHRVLELTRRNEAMFLAQVQMAVTMLEAKDPYTRGHSGRVANLSVAIGQQLGFGAYLLEQLRLGGELHDIGKIGTRDAVLNKPGSLTAEEFAEMKRHTTDGEAMLGVLRDDYPAVLHIVRWHHERLDGSGFPDGLNGDRIPLPARIVSVADAFDAMTTSRPYRNGQSFGQAWSELQRCARSQFDPDVLDAFRIAVAGMTARDFVDGARVQPGA